MVFNSFAFLIFFPIVLLLYRILPITPRMVMLLIASYIFYLSWQPDLIWLIMFTTAVSFVSARLIDGKFKEDRRKQKICLVIALIACLSTLFFFKYFNFVSENVVNLLNLFGLGVSDFTLNLILPVGISFYTFQTLSYVIDVYRGSIKSEKNFFYYALYVTFFPQLVAGPIERPENLLPQLRKKNPFNANDTIIGLKFMMVGFFKKIAVADQISPFVNAVYNNVDSIDGNLVNGFTVLVATLLFAVQIYCDFSGYTDIAIGCARIMGIRLMQNFNDPYSATTIKDFWRRWHISLSSWFTDYIYIPLGGSRCSKPRHLTNLMIVFLVSGIWHGAAWTYILWGVMHGFYQIIGNVTAKPRSALIARLGFNEKGGLVQSVRRVITFALVCIAWMAFRANSLHDLGVLYKTLFTGWGNISLNASMEAIGMNLIAVVTTILSVILIKQMDIQINTKPDKDSSAELFNPARATAYVCVCWTVAVAWLILLASNVESSFIYFQF